MQINKKVSVLFLASLVLTFFIHVYIFPQLPEWFPDSFRTYDDMGVVPYGTNAIGLSLSVLVTFVSLLPIFFIILVIVYFFTRHRTQLSDHIWSKPTKFISDCTQNIPDQKIQFLVLSTLISTMTVFVAVHTTATKLFSSFSDLVGFFDLAGVYDDLGGLIDPSEIASDALIGVLGMFAFLLFGIGPIWLLLIRWAKREQIKNHPGPRVLLSYLYTLATILVFVQIGFFVASDSAEKNSEMTEIQGFSCISDKKSPTTILEFTLYGKTLTCKPLNLAVIVISSMLTSMFAYVVTSRILHNL